MPGGYGKMLAVAARTAAAPGKKDPERPAAPADKGEDTPEGLAGALEKLFAAKSPEERAKAFKAAHRICSSYED